MANFWQRIILIMIIGILLPNSGALSINSKNSIDQENDFSLESDSNVSPVNNVRGLSGEKQLSKIKSKDFGENTIDANLENSLSLGGFVDKSTPEVQSTPYNNYILKEDFTSDVFDGSTLWSRSDNSVFVDEINGYAEISQDGGNDDYLLYNLSNLTSGLSTPITIEYSANLVISGSNYRMPWFEMKYSNATLNSFSYVSTSGWGWGWIGGWQFLTPGVPSENVWFDVKIDIQVNSVSVYVKPSTDTDFNLLKTTNYDGNVNFEHLRFVQPWDSRNLIDYIYIYQPNQVLTSEKWNLTNTTSAPIKRSGHQIVYDTSRDIAILYGGGESGVFYRDTWQFDFNTLEWTNLTSANQGPEVWTHGMVYDTVNDKVILFGGSSSTVSRLDETWAFDYSMKTWSQLFPSTSPPARYRTDMVFDSVNGVALLIGGADSLTSPYSGPWAYNYATNTWTDMSPTSPPPGVYGPQAVFIPDRESLFLFGGNDGAYDGYTWAVSTSYEYFYTNNTWRAVPSTTQPTSRAHGQITYDSLNKKVVVYSGSDWGCAGTCEQYDMWEYSFEDEDWTEVSGPHEPGYTIIGDMLYHEGTQRILLFGGSGLSSVHYGETWIYQSINVSNADGFTLYEDFESGSIDTSKWEFPISALSPDWEVVEFLGTKWVHYERVITSPDTDGNTIRSIDSYNFGDAFNISYRVHMASDNTDWGAWLYLANGSVVRMPTYTSYTDEYHYFGTWYNLPSQLIQYSTYDALTMVKDGFVSFYLNETLIGSYPFNINGQSYQIGFESRGAFGSYANIYYDYFMITNSTNPTIPVEDPSPLIEDFEDANFVYPIENTSGGWFLQDGTYTTSGTSSFIHASNYAFSVISGHNLSSYKLFVDVIDPSDIGLLAYYEDTNNLLFFFYRPYNGDTGWVRYTNGVYDGLASHQKALPPQFTDGLDVRLSISKNTTYYNVYADDILINWMAHANETGDTGLYNYIPRLPQAFDNLVLESQTQTDDTTVPTLTSSPTDFTIEYGSSSTVDWIIEDLNPNIYSVYVNGTEMVTSQVWSSGETISYDLSSLTSGLHNITIQAFDTAMNSLKHTVFVTVEDTVVPVYTNTPFDISYELGSTGNILSWIVTDFDPGTYSITQNSTSVISEQSWESGIAININIDGLNIGNYIYEISVSDGSGNLVTDSVFVEVYQVTAPSVPVNLQVTVGSTSLYLTWDPPDDNGRDAAITYTLYRSTSSGSGYSQIFAGSLTQYNDTSVSTGITYYYVVNATNSGGTSGNSGEATGVIADYPGIPQNFATSAGESFVYLSWQAPLNDGGSAILQYRIYKGETSGNLVLLTTTSQPFYNDTSVNNEQFYYYVVSAENAVGEGLVTTEESAFPAWAFSVPNAPINVTTSIDTDRIIISWDPGFDGGDTIQEYIIYRSIDNVTFVEISRTSSTTYDDTTVTVLFTYFYEISAVNRKGESEKSEIIDDTYLTQPDKPVSIQFTVESNLIVLNWSPPAFNGGSNITEYRIYRSFLSNSSFTEIGSTSLLSFTDTSVEINTTYYYYITAVNIFGESISSTIIAGSLEGQLLPPNSVTLETIIAGNANITINWSHPSSNVSEFVYQIYRAQDGLSYSYLTNTTTLSFLDTNVTNYIGYSYFILVYDTSTLLYSTPSNQLEAIPVLDEISGVNDLQISSNYGFIQLDWTQPHSYLPEYTYSIFRAFNGGDYVWLTSITTTDYLDTEIVAGLVYHYYIIIDTDYGSSLPSNYVSLEAPNPVDNPSSPQNLALTYSENMIHLNWAPPSYSGGSNVSHYLIYRYTPESVENLIGNVTSTSFTDSLISYGQTYTYYVVAVTVAGFRGTESLEVSFSPFEETKPSIVKDVSVSNYTTYLEIIWSEPEGYAPVTGYLVYRSTTESTLVSTNNLVQNSSSLHFLDSIIDAGILYYYAILAYNNYGIGELTVVQGQLVNPIVRISAPENLSVIVEEGKITLTWENPADYGNGELLGFHVYRKVDTSQFSLIIEIRSDSLSFVDTDVTSGHYYSYFVVAYNEIGEGIPTEELMEYLPELFDPPNAIIQSMVTVERSYEGIFLEWIVPAGQPFEFDVYRDGSLIATVGVNHYFDPIDGYSQEYQYHIIARNSAGESRDYDIITVAALEPPGISDTSSEDSNGGFVPFDLFSILFALFAVVTIRFTSRIQNLTIRSKLGGNRK